METALTLVIIAIAGVGGALAHTIAGPKIRQRHVPYALSLSNPTFWIDFEV